MRILVTGAAGFIGYHLAKRLTADGVDVVGFDNVNAYYDPALKRGRLAELSGSTRFTFHEADLVDGEAVERVFADGAFDIVINLAAQAGVRYSLENPHAYISSNVVGFLNLLEACRARPPKHLLYASSSSVYGGSRHLPFSTAQGVDHPVSLYAATKKSNELMAHVYSHLHGIPATGLRFFTVYGPWGRPDMAYFKFAEAMYAGRPITVYNNGDMERDFTYIDEIIEGVARLIGKPPQPDAGFDSVRDGPAKSWAPHRVVNIGARHKEKLMDMIAILERLTGIEAVKRFEPMHPSDVKATWADVSDLEALVGPLPHTSLEEGLAQFLDWYRDYRHAQA